MKIVHLLRHAKAHDDRGINDIDRALTERGIRAAVLMGLYMQQCKLLPGAILCSNAKRTRQTWDHLQTHFTPPVAVTIEPRIYMAEASHLIEIIGECPDSVNEILIIGHNPGLQLLAAEMAKHGDEDLINAVYESFPTATLCSIEFKADHWSAIAHNHKSGKVSRFIAPVDLV